MDKNHNHLRKEIEVLRSELAQLRAIESIHHQAQEGLEAIELQLAGIIHSAMDGIITVDESQTIVLFNAAAEQMFGCPSCQAVGQPLDQFIPQRFQEAHRRHMQQFGKHNVTNRRMGSLGTVFGVRANGEEFPVEASISKVDIGGKKLFTVILRDITERIKAQEELGESQRTLSTLISNLKGMAYRCCNDRDWTMEFVSDGCLPLTGYPPEDLLQNARVSFGTDIILPEDRSRVWETVQAAIQDRRHFQTTYRIKTAQGTEKWVWEHGCGIFASDGTLEALEGFITDVTEQKTLESQLQQAERLAELGTLASGMAHEIGTPMNVILGRAEYLMGKTKEKQTREGLATIITQVERITKIMNQLLSFARKRPVERRDMDLKPVVLDILDVLKERLLKHGISVQTSFASAVSRVFADQDQIAQVLLNLVINAIHAMPKGGRLDVKLTTANPWVTLSITDTGCGIPEEHLPKIFSPFFTTKGVSEGTGLGLTVVHGIIQEHEGKIEVQSEEGKGTVFTVSLPVYDPNTHGP